MICFEESEKEVLTVIVTCPQVGAILVKSGVQEVEVLSDDCVFHCYDRAVVTL
jgi:hypothetical protein